MFPHSFKDPADVSAIAGRWLICNEPSIGPRDQAGIEFTTDGRLIILRLDSNGEIVRSLGSDSAATYHSRGASRAGGGFELSVTSDFDLLAGNLYDCPKRLTLRKLFGDADERRNDYVFDTGSDPGTCDDDRPAGCDGCGNVTCPPGASLNSACRCGEPGREVLPLSQTCNFCCGKTCAPGEFLDYACQCYSR